jgi:hypothetical protein
MKKGVKPVAQHGVVCKLHNTDGCSATHLALKLLEDSWLQSLQDHAVRPLDLSVRLWVGNNRPVHTDVVVVAEVEEFFPRELGAVVGMIVLGMPKR